jgi:hypothetical protein
MTFETSTLLAVLLFIFVIGAIASCAAVAAIIIGAARRANATRPVATSCAALVAIIRGAVRGAKEARPARSHRLVLALCGVFLLSLCGMIVLMAMGVGTGRADGLAVRVSLPTHAPPPLPEAKGPFGLVETPPTRFIATVLLVDWVGDRFRPLDGKSFIIDWPPPFAREASPPNCCTVVGVLRGTKFSFGIFVSQLFRRESGDGTPASTYIHMRPTTQNKYMSIDCSGGEVTLDSLHEVDIGRAQPIPFFGLTLGNTARNPRLLVHLTRAAPDDPLRQVSAAEWLAGDARQLPVERWKTSLLPAMIVLCPSCAPTPKSNFL